MDAAQSPLQKDECCPEALNRMNAAQKPIIERCILLKHPEKAWMPLETTKEEFTEESEGWLILEQPENGACCTEIQTENTPDLRDRN
jgi:hypothetical protein